MINLPSLVLQSYKAKFSEVKVMAWFLTNKKDRSGFAEVWRGNLEQSELYHEQLACHG
tara:strand:- start:738 stop:911 length:174 start_codon:yes stop_codon:yes gene_type:complete